MSRRLVSRCATRRHSNEADLLCQETYSLSREALNGARATGSAPAFDIGARAGDNGLVMDRTSLTAVRGAMRREVTTGLPPPVVVADPEAFGAMLQALASQPIIALDTESDSLYRYFHKVCLLQISTLESDYLVDPLRLSELAPLGEILANPGIEKVFHAAENDILALKRDYGFQFAHIFDTMFAARILGCRQVSLAALLQDRLGIEVDKRTQLTDWGRRPLTEEQLNYARLDTRYLIPLRHLLHQELVARGRWCEAQEAFLELPRVSCAVRSFDPEGFWRSRHARELSPAQLAVLRELYLWRDEQARAMNRPPFKIVSDEALVRLSREQPRRLADLPLSEQQIRRFGGSILAAIARGRAAPPPQPPNRHPNKEQRLDAATVARYDSLRAWRSQRAVERGVAADIILTNDALLTIARAAPVSLDMLDALGIMGPWKLQEYGAELLKVLAAAR